MSAHWLQIFVPSFLEGIAILAIAYAINTNAKIGIAKSLAFAAVFASLSYTMDHFQASYHIAVSTVAGIALFLALKRPTRKLIVNYTIDILLAFVVLTLAQLAITGIAGLFSVDLIQNEMAIIFILAGLAALAFWLSSKLSVRIFFEKYYMPNRLAILFSAISLMILITMIGNLVFFYEDVFAHDASGQIYFLLAGYFVATLSLGLILIRERKAAKNNAVMQKYGELLQNSIKQYIAHIHDYKNHMQMILALNKDEEGSIINKEQQAYIEGLISGQNRIEGVSIVQDSVPVSAMLNQQKEYARQRNIEFSVNVGRSVAPYRIPEIELVDILYNLINNAFEEAEKLDLENRLVQIDFGDGFFEIRNRVTLSLAKEETAGIDRFFEQGYSTKGSGRGFGLSNVLSSVKQNGIRLDRELVDGTIIFRLEFPEDSIETPDGLACPTA